VIVGWLPGTLGRQTVSSFQLFIRPDEQKVVSKKWGRAVTSAASVFGYRRPSVGQWLSGCQTWAVAEVDFFGPKNLRLCVRIFEV